MVFELVACIAEDCAKRTVGGRLTSHQVSIFYLEDTAINWFARRDISLPLADMSDVGALSC